MKYLALAALAGTFWFLVAIAHVLIGDGGSHPCRCTARCTRAVPRLDQVPVTPYVPPPAPINRMEKMAVVRGMSAVKPEIARCYAVYGVPGMALVNVVIAPSGVVSSAKVTGRFADTPTGACVEQAVRTARFPPSDGLRTPYPFQLR
jgi:hypothetical protein